MVYSTSRIMKGKIAFIFTALFTVLGVASQYPAARSVRENSIPVSKSDQRPGQPSPTATPTSRKPVVDTSPDSDDGEVIKVSTQIVSVPVRVMDKKGRFVAGLTKENFKVFADGVEQQIALFSNEQEPFTVALVLDMSYSTNFKIAEIQAAALSFIDQLRPQDKVMVISFDQDVHLLCEATNDRKAIYSAIKSTKIGTGTSLYEAVEMVMNGRLRQIEGRKAIILFTDGVDTTSRKAVAMSNLNDAMELDALIYPIRYDTYADVQRMRNGSARHTYPPASNPIPGQSGRTFPSPIPTIGESENLGTTAEDYETARRYLEQLAIRTGGRTYLADSLENLSDGFAKIAGELREFYSLGIYPDDSNPGKPKLLKVRIDQPGLAVRARDSFVIGKKGPGN